MFRNEAGRLERRARSSVLLASWFAAAVAACVAAAPTPSARAADLPPDIGTGTLLFQTGNGFDYAAPLWTDVRISVTGIAARVSVAQRFHNAGTEWAEAVYAFPLPDGAAVDRLRMEIGERVIEGEIREKEEAKRVYDEARDAGRRASLVTQTTPNLFTTQVANIAPGDSIYITIEYLDVARYDAGEFSLRFPMTFTPRYETAEPPPDPALPPDAPAAFVPAVAGTLHQAAIGVELTPGMPLESVGARHHDVRVSQAGASYDVRTAGRTVPMNRDFVLAWRPVAGTAPAVHALTETVGGRTYVLLMVLPPAQTHAFRSRPREVIYVVDTSGSMGGEPIAQAKLALANALERLSPGDRFNVLRFDSTTSGLFRSPAALTDETRADALRFVERLTADGGTEIDGAIRAALAQPASPSHVRQVVFLTDGAVASETQAFKTIEGRLGDARLFTIGIGAAPNSHFMRKAAQFGRGAYTHIGDAADVAPVLDALFAKLERIALTDVLVDWPAAAELYPLRIPDLYAGEPIVVAGSLEGERNGPVAIDVVGRVAGGPWSASVEAMPASSAGIAALWARRKIEFLIDSRVQGVGEPLIRSAVIDTALEHHLVSPYTSLVAVDRTPARSEAAALERRAVGNMAPAGTSLAHIPSTATPAEAYRWIGLAMILAVVLAHGRRGGRGERAR